MITALHLLRSARSGPAGGDLVHLQALVDGLRAEGVEAVAAGWDDAPPQVDVVHLYNLDRPGLLAADWRRARQQWPSAKVVVTPIFWPWKLRTVLGARDPRVVDAALRAGLRLRLGWSQARRVLASADAVFPCSSAEATELQHYFRLRPRPTWAVAPTGVWLSEWQNRHDGEEGQRLRAELGLGRVRHVVACVGRVEARKNQHSLVRAVAALPNVGLVLLGGVGRQSYADAVTDLARRHLPGRFAWPGPAPATEVRDLLRAVDVHVLASVREVAALANLEAAAAGVEVVTTRVGAAEEYFADDAHYCASPSADSIAEAIRRALVQPLQPRSRAVVGRHDWSVAASLTAACYRRLL